MMRILRRTRRSLARGALAMLVIACGARPPVVDASFVAAHDRDDDGPREGAQAEAPAAAVEGEHGDGEFKRGDEASCVERSRSAADALGVAASGLSYGCHEDADCILVGSVTSCFVGCPMSVLALQREAYEHARTAADVSHCSDHEADGCPRFERRCAHEVAACTEGRCAVRLAAP